MMNKYSKYLQSNRLEFFLYSGCVLSVRMAFIPIVGNIMLSADFCQLELRILAHFCEDPILCKLMHEQGDIFRNIAARLNKISEDKVHLYLIALKII